MLYLMLISMTGQANHHYPVVCFEFLKLPGACILSFLGFFYEEGVFPQCRPNYLDTKLLQVTIPYIRVKCG